MGCEQKRFVRACWSFAMSQLLFEQELLSFHPVGVLAAPEVWIQAPEWWLGWCWLVGWPQPGAYPGFQCFIWEVHRLASAGDLADACGRIRWQTPQKSGQESWCFVLSILFKDLLKKKKKEHKAFNENCDFLKIVFTCWGFSPPPL